jgi:hypothetical protein
MHKNPKLTAMLIALLLGLVSLGAPGRALAQTCDVTGTVNGSATPIAGVVGDTLVFRGTGFTPNENVSFWFTLPNGGVFGTANPVQGGVNPDGTIGPLAFQIPQSFGQFPGRWAITFQGTPSNHQAIIYFCVGFRAQAETPTPVPPAATNTPVPPAATATSQPTAPAATATSEATAPAATATSEATAPAATATTEATAQPTAQPTAAPPSVAATGSLSVGDQVIRNNTVVIDSVTVSQDGWVVVHPSNPDGTIKVPDNIGKAPVKAGTTTNLQITLDRPAVTGEKVWPMLHIDAGAPGVYEFPGVDAPVVVNGEVVMMPVFLTVESTVVVGMPRTGQADMALLVVVAMTALGLLTAGLLARRRISVR